MGDLWIVIPRWDEFQHYKDRDPPWIKLYLDLLQKPEYLDLSGHLRAILHGLWMLYALSHCQLRLDTRSISRRLGLRVTSRQLLSLYHAGFIDISASKPLEQRQRQRQKNLQGEESEEQGWGELGDPLLDALLDEIPNANGKTREAVYYYRPKLPDGAFADVRERLAWKLQNERVANPAGWVVTALREKDREGAYR